MLLEIGEVTRLFGGIRALDGVSFSVESGEVHGLIGPNGAGKTTLLNILSGIIPPSSGEIRFMDHPVHSLPAHRMARLGIARTFQNIRLFPNMTCLENVIAGQHLVAGRPLLPRLLCLPSPRREEREHREKAIAILARVGLDNRVASSAYSLSYGERRRLEIGRALASNPRMLLLDEPVAGMRQKGLEAVAELVRSLASEGMTILLIEHNMRFVMQLCSRVTVLSFGRVIASGSPAEITGDPKVMECYLGTGEEAVNRDA